MENQGRQRGAIGLVEGKRERRKEQNSIKEEKKKGDSLTRVRSLSQRSQANPILSARRNVPWIPVLITYPSSLRDNLFYRSLGVAMFHRSGMFDQPNVFSPLALGRLPFVASPSNARH